MTSFLVVQRVWLHVLKWHYNFFANIIRCCRIKEKSFSCSTFMLSYSHANLIMTLNTRFFASNFYATLTNILSQIVSLFGCIIKISFFIYSHIGILGMEISNISWYDFYITMNLFLVINKLLFENSSTKYLLWYKRNY